MPEKLLIINLEDNANDTELIQEMLVSEGIACEIVRVETREDFLTAIAHEGVDLILADYALPAFDGFAALALAAERCPDVPFVFVTGTMGEEIAIESLKHGATDYVLKQHLARLVPVVRRALREAEDQRERKRAEAALRESEQRFRQMAETIHEVFWMTEPAFAKILYISVAYELIWQRARAELHANPQEWLNSIHPEDVAQVRANLAKQLRGFATTEEFRIIRVDGTLRWIENRSYPILNNAGEVVRVTGLAEDITVRKRAEEQIKTALAEKETLLRELYHRTKNNMQVIRAMLVLQAAHHPNASLAAFVQTIEQKIHAMALVHEKLYQAHDLSRINLSEYISDLTFLLMQSYQVSDGKIALRLEDMEHMSVLIDTAIPCGLVLNELMSNALKHAFPDGRSGEIRISLRRRESGDIALRFADNGVGTPAGFDFRRQPTLGLQTIIAITEHQLHGEVHFEAQNGLACAIRFQDNVYTPRV